MSNFKEAWYQYRDVSDKQGLWLLTTVSIVGVSALAAVGVGALPMASAAPRADRGTATGIHSACRDVGYAPSASGSGFKNYQLYPYVVGGRKPSEIYGRIISGNNKGEPVELSANNDAVGEIHITYDPNSYVGQASKIAVSVVVPGYEGSQACPVQTISVYGPRTLE